jgi:hypothetical protein
MTVRYHFSEVHQNKLLFREIAVQQVKPTGCSKGDEAASCSSRLTVAEWFSEVARQTGLVRRPRCRVVDRIRSTEH